MYIIRIQIEWYPSYGQGKLRADLRSFWRGLRKKFGAALIVVGVLLVFFVPGFRHLSQKDSFFDPKSSDASDNKEVSQEVVYDHGPIQADASLLSGDYQEEQVPTKIVVPSVGIDVIVKTARVVGSKWEIFEDAASFGQGSSLPGFVGNSVIFAHAREGYFLPLKNIKKENAVYVLAQNKWYLYKVNEIKEVYPSDVSVIGPTSDETLTLYTCSGFADSKRLIVVAKRV